MSSALQDLVEGKIDFEGQQLAETITRYVLIASTVIALLAGFAAQSVRVTFGLLGSSTVLLALIVVPPWPVYKRHPVKWLPVKEKKTQ